MIYLAQRLGVVLTKLAASAVSVQTNFDDWGRGMHPMWWMWGPLSVGMMLGMLALWGLVIFGVVVGVRWLARLNPSPRRDRAVEILRERYARGEITREEFEVLKRDLG